MSSQAQYKNNENESQNSEQLEFSPKDKKVNLNDLVDRMNQEKKKERNSNLILSIAALSAVAVFGVILTL